jgi:hypothetical protein
MHSNNFQQQPIFVNIPEYQPELYLQHPNTSLQSLLASETSSIGSPTSVSSDFELYGDDFYNMAAASPVYPAYPTQFDEWSQYAPSSPSGSIQYFPEATSYPQPQPSPAKRARKAVPEPCNCMYCLPTSAPSAQAPPQHMHHGVPRKNVPGGGVIAASPPLQLQFQIDIAPKPIIVGQHGLGADAAYLQTESMHQQQREQSIFDGEQHFYAHGY